MILHLLVYPSSNGYNSYMDMDEAPIGGLLHPMKPTKELFYVSIVMDCLALLLSLYLNPVFALGILLYILASRAYSYRKIRLKRFPIIGFLTVFICQGMLIFYITSYVLQRNNPIPIPFINCITASLLIGALYPLTQIYQHNEDKADGVITISFILGKRGTFVFSGLLFIVATVLLFIRFNSTNRLNHFILFLLIMLPVVLYFMYWMNRVWLNESAADFKHSLYMNILSTVCTTAYFITLIIQNH